MINIITVAGIRPDFIRFNAIYKELDKRCNIRHTLVHTGQHYDELLSDVFFKELEIREPDYNLHCGAPGKEHYKLAGDITNRLIETIQLHELDPDIILFLGDTNSVVCSVGLKKEGYTLGHIEAGMRSGDRRMLEEINRTICDHCCDYFFVYHEDYRKNLLREGIYDNIYVVGNTIVEVAKPIIKKIKRRKRKQKHILVDIHRPENFKYKNRMKNILTLVKELQKSSFYLPVKWLDFPRATNYIKEYDLDMDISKEGIELVPLMSYKEYLRDVYNSAFLISDSGTAQEEPALLEVPVVVPRDFTERPQSVDNNCSIMVDVNESPNWPLVHYWLVGIDFKNIKMEIDWLGDGKTAKRIVDILEKELYKSK